MALKDWEHVDYGQGSTLDGPLYRQWIEHCRLQARYVIEALNDLGFRVSKRGQPRGRGVGFLPFHVVRWAQGLNLDSTDALKHKYPDHALLVTMDSTLNLSAFPEARLTVHGADGPLSRVTYRPPKRRGAGPGQLIQDVQFATYRLDRKSVV